MGGHFKAPDGGWEAFEQRMKEHVREMEACGVDMRPELPVWIDEPGEYNEYKRREQQKRLEDKMDS